MNRNLWRSLIVALALPLGACVDGMPQHTGQAVGGACMQSSACEPGLECEVEHGQGTCQPHRGGRDGGEDQHHDGGDDDGGGMACTVDADCPPGQECQIEHGGSFCKPHGGRG